MTARKLILALLTLPIPFAVAARSAVLEPEFTFSIADNSYVSEAEQQIEVQICSEEELTTFSAYHSHSGGGSSVSLWDGPAANCSTNYGYAWMMYVTLEVGVNQLQVSADAYSDDITINLSLPPASPVIAVGPDTTRLIMNAGVVVKQPFQVVHGDQYARAYDLTISCTGSVTCTGMSQPSELNFGGPGSQTVMVSYSVSGATAASGTLKLKAVEQGAATNKDSALAIVQVAPSGPAVVRSDCLTIAVGGGGAFECGELRLSHALPAVRSINSVRAPVLTYVSEQAQPYPIFTVLASRPLGSATPDSIVTSVQINSQTYRKSVPGSQAGAGQNYWMKVAFDAINDTTGLYAYTLEVRSHTGGNSSVLKTETGSRAIVNRKDSPFGAGWWVGGLEKLVPLTGNRMLWIGGDGSTKVYEQMGTTATHVVYMAPLRSYADTLLKKSSDNTWTRRLQSGGSVGFNASLQHVSTTNRLGFATTFTYGAGGRLSQITVAPAAAGLTYAFTYDGNDKLDYVTSPDSVTGTTRTTQITVAGGVLTAIADPGISGSITFGYDPTITRRIVSRADRRGGLVKYGFDAAHRVASSTIKISASDSSHSTFCAAESRGLTSCHSTLPGWVDHTTVVDGARRSPDPVDTTRFTTSPSTGRPYWIRDALGGQTYLSMGDARFPALVTRLQTADGHITSAAYDHRGNVVETVDSALVSGGVYAKTKYEWHAKWNSPTRVIAPAGTYTQMDYDATTGNLLWQQDARGTSSRTTYAYYTSSPYTGLLRAITRPGASRGDTLTYDATRLNVSATRSAARMRSVFLTDSIGRVKVARTLIDSTANTWKDDSVAYDRMNRVIKQVAYGPWIVGVDTAMSVTVTNTYDAEGNPLSLTRSLQGFFTHAGLTTSWSYDTAGRQIREVVPGGDSTKFVYDPAGNVKVQRTRRGDSLYTFYDALGRVTMSIVPPTNDTLKYRLGAANVDTAAHNPAYGPYPFTRDTTTFEYDAVGRMVRAANPDARIARTYHLWGGLRYDSLFIKTWARTGEHAYGLEYLYDAHGRMTTLKYPAALVAGTSGQASYQYDGTTGFISQVTGLQGEQFGMLYNGASDLIRLTMPGSIVDTSAYTDDGRLRFHGIKNNTAGGLEDRFGAAWIDSTSIWYNIRGLIDSTVNKAAAKDKRFVRYNGLGMVERDSLSATGGVNIRGQSLSAQATTELAGDAMGNLRQARETFNVSVASGSGLIAYSAYQSSGTTKVVTLDSLLRVTRQQRSGEASDQTFQYDKAGNTKLSTFKTWNPFGYYVRYDDRVSYYDAANVVRQAERRIHIKPEQAYPGNWYPLADLQRHIETYRYDPLGRRVMVRAEYKCHTYNASLPQNCSYGTMRRIVWAGAQELVEVQRPVEGIGSGTLAQMESDTDALALPVRTNLDSFPTYFDLNPQYGRVAYTHGMVIDRPLSVTRLAYVDRVAWYPSEPALAWPTFTVVPHWTARGEAVTGTFANGAVKYDTTLSGGHERSVGVEWNLGSLAYNRLVPDSIGAWQGSLLTQKLDLTGTLYRRNRSYDPATGRFTQEDPIGFAGGLNAYGYANGNPISMSDPFGLRACFQGSAADRLELEHGVSVGTGTTFSVVQQPDGQHCAENVQPQGKSWTSAGLGFKAIAGATAYTLYIAKGAKGSGSFFSVDLLSYDSADLAKQFVTAGDALCKSGPYFQLGQIFAHELGHAHAILSGQAPFKNLRAQEWEYEWSGLNGTPRRDYQTSYSGCPGSHRIP